MDQRPIGDIELPCRLSMMLCLLVVERASGVDTVGLERFCQISVRALEPDGMAG